MTRYGKARALAQLVRSVAKLVERSPSPERLAEPIVENSVSPIMVTILQEHYQTLLNRVDMLTKTIFDLRDKVDDVHSQSAVSKTSHRSPVLEAQRRGLPSLQPRELSRSRRQSHQRQRVDKSARKHPRLSPDSSMDSSPHHSHRR